MNFANFANFAKLGLKSFAFRESLKTQKISNTTRECKTFADHLDFQFDGKFCQINEKIAICK